MVDYKDFEAIFVKENRRFKTALVLCLFICSITCLSVITSKTYFIYNNGKIFEERLLAEDVCKASFESLASGTPNSSLISKDIIELVEKEPFYIKLDNILRISSLEKGACKIIIKSEAKLLAFKIGLAENSSFPFHYKLIQLDELPIKEEVI